MNTMKYKGFLGSIEISVEDGCLFGKLLHIRDLVLYQGQTVHELRQAFESSADDYIRTCEELGCEPKRPCSGSFNIRIGQEMHLEAVEAATLQRINLNEYVKLAIKEKLDSTQHQAVQIHQHNHSHVYTTRFTTTLTQQGQGVDFYEPQVTINGYPTNKKTAHSH